MGDEGPRSLDKNGLGFWPASDFNLPRMATPPPGKLPIALTSSVVAAEQRAREFLAQAKWRKARDELKPLVKLDRVRYLSLLIQANLGLVRELMAKGLVADAQPILAYLATIAPAEQLRAVELEMAGKTGKHTDILPRCVAALCEASLQLPASERCSLADQTILAFQDVPDATDPACVRLAAEVRAVHDALLAISMQQWERATEALRSISHRSAFSHWTVFLKGVMAFHGGDTARAARCFAGLPPNSVTAKASQTYLLLAGRMPLAKQGQPIPEPVLDAACRLAGYASAGRVLLRAEQHWKAGRHTESYRSVRDTVAQFPTESGDWLGALTEFYFRAAHSMSEADSREYLRFFDNLQSRRAAKNGVEEMLSLRLFALTYARGGDSMTLRSDWEGYLRLLDRLHQPNPRRASIGYGWLGEHLAQPGSSFGLFRARTDSLRDPDGALKCLQKAIALDPNNLPAHLTLVAVYGKLAKISERNRLLDEMSERFPEEKPVLLEAARRCLDRKAFVKGLDFLKRARQIDRIDPAIPELIVTARHQLARQYFQQHRVEKGRQALAETEEFLTDHPDDFQRNRWTARLHHGLLERLYGDAAAGEVQLSEARTRSPFPAAFALFAHLAHRACVLDRRSASPFLDELRTALKNSPSAARAVLLRRLLQFWINAAEKLDLRAEEGWLRSYVKAAAKAPFTREEARQLIEIPDNKLVYESPHESALLLFVKKVLRDDPQDPLFRLYEHTLRTSWLEASPQAHAKLESILEEAVRRRDDHTTQRVRKMLKLLDQPPLPPLGPLGPDFDEPEDFDEGPPDFGKPFPGNSPKDLEQIEILMEMLLNASEPELRNPRKRRPKGKPDAMLDPVIEAARKGLLMLSPLKPAPPKSLPAPPPPPPDPNQFNLL